MTGLEPLPAIRREEVLRYLGYRKGQEIGETMPLLDRGEELIRQAARPRWVAERLPFTAVSRGIVVGENALLLPGGDIASHLSSSKGECILMAVTLGSEVERVIRYWQRMDMALSLVLDATATAAVEEVCDRLEERLREQCRERGEGLTFRYSPGYGDLPIDLQNDFLTVLGAPKAIGLTANRSHLLLPRKSVTAVLGVTPLGIPRSPKGCGACANYEHCSFRKEGISCGY